MKAHEFYSEWGELNSRDIEPGSLVVAMFEATPETYGKKTQRTCTAFVIEISKSGQAMLTVVESYFPEISHSDELTLDLEYIRPYKEKKSLDKPKISQSKKKAEPKQSTLF